MCSLYSQLLSLWWVCNQDPTINVDCITSATSLFSFVSYFSMYWRLLKKQQQQQNNKNAIVKTRTG